MAECRVFGRNLKESSLSLIFRCNNLRGETIPMIAEMGAYKTRSGSHPEIFKIFRRKSIPVHAEIGMKIRGPLLSVKNPGTFALMRDFPDLESR